MKIILTTHAKKRMAERGIKMEHIKLAVDLPDYTIKKEGKIEFFKKVDSKTLRIVASESDNYIKIITLAWK